MGKKQKLRLAVSKPLLGGSGKGACGKRGGGDQPRVEEGQL